MLRRALKRSRFVIVAINLARWAWLSVVYRVRPNRPARLGARHADWSLEQSLAYVDWVVDEYGRYGGLDAETLDGRRVLELGPGDNLGVALRLLALGAGRVTCLDRFVTYRDPEQQRRLNAAVVERLGREELGRLEGVLSAAGEIRGDQDRLVLIEGTPVEEATAVLPAAGFDAVISRAVLAHVYDLDAAYAAMDALLAPGGAMAHKIDLSDLGIFGEHNPLTFLTVSDRIWDPMRRYAGHSNRRLIDYHRGELERLGYEGEFLVTRLLGGEELRPPIALDQVGSQMGAAAPLIDRIRPKLLARYRALPGEDLAVADVFMRARKP